MKKDKELEEWYTKANNLAWEGKLEEAILCYDKVLEINSQNTDAWSEKAFLYVLLNRINEAGDCYDRMLQINPENAQAWYEKGFWIYPGLQEFEEALKCFDIALILEPQNREFWDAKVQILRELSRDEEIVSCLDRVIEIDPLEATSWNDKGNTLIKLNRFDEAILCFDKAIEINPRYEDAWSNKGIALQFLGRLEEAINYFDKALEVNPKHIDSLVWKTYCLMYLKRFEEANRCIDKAIAIDPSNDNLIKLKERISIDVATSNVSDVETKIDFGDIPKVLPQEIGVVYHLLELEQYLKKRIIGQDKAIEHISRRIIMAHAGIIKRQGPLAVFLFLGPTGVGKTEMAKQLAEFLFGSESEMIRLDMSEYMEPHSVSKLTGSPPGYIGYEEEGQLTNKLFLKPNSVVLLDEIEKADTRVYDVFLQVFGEGRLTDAKGKTIDAKNSIFIMTSNILLPQEQNEDNSLFMFGTHGRKEKNIFDEPTILNELKKHFRPEFINRIDEIVIFDELNEESVKHILQIMLGDISDSLFSQHRVRLGFDNQAINTILKAGYNSEFGVRELRRTVERLIEVPLSRLILSEEIRKHSQWQVVCTEEGLSIIPID